MKVVCISDTHNLHLHRMSPIDVPDGDLLIHCGDATMQGKQSEVWEFAKWFKALPHRHKIFVPGNHDFAFEPTHQLHAYAMGQLSFAHVLIDSLVVVDGLRVWGSPYQPWFLDWAFNVERGEALRIHWDQIPNDLDILVTNTPPAGILDRVERGEAVGCVDLRFAVERVRPQLHAFGHIHCAYGQHVERGTHFVNCALASEAYWITNPAVVMDVEPK